VSGIVQVKEGKVKPDLACICGSFGIVIDVQMSFGRVICMLGGSRSPLVMDLALGLATA
jgi:hypothetical protein